MIGIYAIIHISSSKVYVGSSFNIKGRWSDHKKTLRGNRHDNRYLQNAWNKYSENDFKFIILEQCKEDISVDELLCKEKEWFDKTNCCDRACGFNIAIDPINGGAGWNHTEKSKQKMRGPRPSIAGKNNPMYNRHHSEETKAKISRSRSAAGNPKWNQDRKLKLSINNGHAKLKPSEVKQIRIICKYTDRRDLDIANEFGVDRRTINGIRHNKIWKNLL